MSCPDWRSVTAWRDGDGPAPAGWPEHLDHLADCVSCRQRLAELDATLLLAAAAVPVPQPDAAEIGEVKAAVRSLVAAERLVSSARPDRRSLIAAAALVALLAAPLGLSRLLQRPVAFEGSVEASMGTPEPAWAPPVEEVQPAAARVYQFGNEELPVVLIFDENLDL